MHFPTLKMEWLCLHWYLSACLGPQIPLLTTLPIWLSASREREVCASFLFWHTSLAVLFHLKWEAALWEGRQGHMPTSWSWEMCQWGYITESPAQEWTRNQRLKRNWNPCVDTLILLMPQNLLVSAVTDVNMHFLHWCVLSRLGQAVLVDAVKPFSTEAGATPPTVPCAVIQCPR